MGQRQKYSPNLKHVRHLHARNLLGPFLKDAMVWSRFDDDVEWVFAENVLDGLVSCS